MSKKIIAVDIDEVLSETLKSMFKKNNSQLNGKHINWEDITQYDLWNIENFGVTKKQAIFMFAKHQLGSGLFNKIEPVQWAKKKILQGKEKGYKFYAVTARLSILKPSTILWINKHFYGCFEKIIFANFYTKRAKMKVDICKEIGAQILIEDNLETCIECANEGIKCYLLDKPWNKGFDPQKYPLITKVNSWTEIEF